MAHWGSVIIRISHLRTASDLRDALNRAWSELTKIQLRNTHLSSFLIPLSLGEGTYGITIASMIVIIVAIVGDDGKAFDSFAMSHNRDSTMEDNRHTSSVDMRISYK
jgi:hypothetical protein